MTLRLNNDNGNSASIDYVDGVSTDSTITIPEGNGTLVTNDFTGDVDIDGDVSIGGGDIELNADGSADFADGNVNIAANGRLKVGQADTANNASIEIVAGNSPAADVYTLINGFQSDNTTTAFEIRANGSATFNGRLIAGTATSNFTHQMNGSVNSTNGIMMVHNRSDFDANPAAQFRVGSSTTGTTNSFINFSLNNGVSGAGAIVGNGPSACTFGGFSDRRLKTDITELPSQWDNIKALKPSQFKFIDNLEAGTQAGFIAQEIQEVYPEAVGLSPIAVPVAERSDPNVEETVDRLMLAGWSKTEAYLVKALQECMTRIETLESRLSTLEGGNNP